MPFEQSFLCSSSLALGFHSLAVGLHDEQSVEAKEDAHHNDDRGARAVPHIRVLRDARVNEDGVKHADGSQKELIKDFCSASASRGIEMHLANVANVARRHR